MSKGVSLIARSAATTPLMLALLLIGSCTDMGPTLETSGSQRTASLPPTAPQSATVGSRSASPTGRRSPSAEAPKSGTHRVRSGETVYTIARHYGVDAYALVSLNKLTPPFDLFEGQRLAIPDQKSLPSTVVTAEPNQATPRKPVSRPNLDTPGQSEAQTPRSIETPASPSAIAGAFIWPVEGRIISDFGAKGGGRFNDGINIAAPAGTAVRAAADGVVAYAGNELRGFGNMLLIKHPGGWVTAYAHNQELLVRRGSSVGRGQAIARVGSTGGVDQPQLHFELRKGKKAVDPLDYLRRPSASAIAGRDSG